jgi:hypothetical protein
MLKNKRLDMAKLKEGSVFLLYSLLLLFSIYMMFHDEKSSSLWQSFFVAFLMIPITYYATIHFFESKKIRRWNAIKKVVTEKLGRELSGLFIGVSNIVGFDRAFSVSHEATEEEIDEIIKNKEISQLKQLAENKNAKIDSDDKDLLLDGKFGTLFERRKQYLDDFQLKYLEYMESDTVVCLMSIRDALKNIDTLIVIRNKSIKNNWLRLYDDESIIKMIEHDLNEIIYNLYLLYSTGILEIK